MATDDKDHTFITRFRIPKRLWDAYGTAAQRQGTDRSTDLVNHVRDYVREHGDAQELTELEAAEKELADRRTRKGGRPRKSDQPT
ncbi:MULTISPECIES: hypothetical protein [Streptomyces]|uniref:CopG family transcriptional regulator n=1 Tax=Streptomyces flavovirens TaxID=52258 RepID=A0ABV8NE76_9ACTN|nr:hypothetical protein [Streptomyces sp. MBT51]MBK3596269.1 hypothetical protein [Streptomyces sp. MBT51]